MLLFFALGIYVSHKKLFQLAAVFGLAGLVLMVLMFVFMFRSPEHEYAYRRTLGRGWMVPSVPGLFVNDDQAIEFNDPRELQGMWVVRNRCYYNHTGKLPKPEKDRRVRIPVVDYSPPNAVGETMVALNVGILFTINPVPNILPGEKLYWEYQRPRDGRSEIDAASTGRFFIEK